MPLRSAVIDKCVHCKISVSHKKNTKKKFGLHSKNTRINKSSTLECCEQMLYKPTYTQYLNIIKNIEIKLLHLFFHNYSHIHYLNSPRVIFSGCRKSFPLKFTQKSN